MMPTDDEIRRVLAEKLMGMKPIEGFYYYGDDTWNPLRKIEQAMACAEKFVYWFCRKDKDTGTYEASVAIGNEIWGANLPHGSSETSPAEAISRACYDAVKEG